MVEIRQLTDRDAQDLWDFRLRALESEPRAFGESAEEHRDTQVEAYAQRLRCRGRESFVFGAFEGSTLIGMAGFKREQYVKRRHKGFIWGVFIAPEWRGKGVGRALVVRVIQEARTLDGVRSVSVSVAVTQEAARRMYCRLGFRSFGVEPQALKVNDCFVGEEHMILEF